MERKEAAEGQIEEAEKRISKLKRKLKAFSK